MEPENFPMLEREESVTPRLPLIRRVHTCYQQALPLSIMKRYQCVVIAAAAGTLTVALTQEPSEPLLHLLRSVTGRAIFPVLIAPRNLDRLLQQVQHKGRVRAGSGKAPLALHPHHARSLVLLQEAGSLQR